MQKNRRKIAKMPLRISSKDDEKGATYQLTLLKVCNVAKCLELVIEEVAS